MDTSISAVPTPAIAEVQLDTSVISEAESDLPSHDIKAENSSSIKEGDHDAQLESQVPEETLNADSDVSAVNILPEALPSTVVDVTNNHLISTSSTATAGGFIGEIPVVANIISDESTVSAPLNEENPLQQFEATADSQDFNAVIEDSQNVIPSHEPATEGNDISDSTVEEGALTDTSVNAAVPASLVESIEPNVEHTASGDISKPESELPLGDVDPVDNPQDNDAITTSELDTGPAHVNEMPFEVVKDKDDVAAEPSVDPTSEFSTNLGGASIHSYPLGSTLDAHIDAEPIVLGHPQVPNDASDIADEQEQSAEQPEIFELEGSSMAEFSISAETGASQQNVTTEPSEVPKRSMETPNKSERFMNL